MDTRKKIPFWFALLTSLTLISACGGGGSETPAVPSNQSPNASISVPDIVGQLAEVTLDASASSDQDGSITEYEWEQVSGTDVTLSDTNQAVVTFSAPAEASAQMQFRVTVTDDDGARSSSTATVTTNTPPLADAGSDKQIVETQSVELSGSQSSDVDENVVSYNWRQLSGPMASIASPSEETTDVVAPVVDVDTELVFELTVADEFETSSNDTVTIIVLANQAPIVEMAFPLDGGRFEGSEISVSGKVIDDRDLSQNTVTISTSQTDLTTSVDENGHFSIDLALDSSVADTIISVTAEDNISESSLTENINLRNQPLITKGRMAMHPVKANTALFIEDTFGQNRIYEINLESGTTRTVFEQQDSIFGQVLDVKVDLANNRLLIKAFSGDYYFTAVDLENYSFARLVPNELDGQITIGYGRDFALIPDSDEVLIADSENGVLIKASLASGNRQIVSGPELGTGLSFSENIIPFVSESGEWIVLDTALQTTFSIEPETGNRSIIGEIGRGLFGGSKVLDESRQKIISVSVFDSRVRILDIQTGEVETLLNLNDRFDATSAWQVLHDELDDRYIIMQFGENSGQSDIDNIISIDPDTLSSEVLFDDYVGQRSKVKINGDIVFDQQNKRLFGISNQDVIYSFDPETLSTQIVSQNNSGDLIELESLFRIALNPRSGDLYATEWSTQTIVSIDPETGQKALVLDLSQSDEYQTSSVVDIDFSDDGESLYILLRDENQQFSLVSYAIAGSDITLVTNNQVGSNSRFIQPFTISVNDGVIYVADHGTGATSTVSVQEVDIETGDTRIISQGAINSSIYIEPIAALNKLLVAESGNMRLVDIETGQIETLSFHNNDLKIGRGRTAQFRDIAVDFSTSRVFAVDSANEILFAVDINTGDRIVLQRQ